MGIEVPLSVKYEEAESGMSFRMKQKADQYELQDSKDALAEHFPR